MRGKQKRIAIPVKHMRNLLDALDALEKYTYMGKYSRVRRI